MKKLTIGVTALALTLSGAAYADHHRGMKSDADGDGVVTRAEVQAHAAKMFAWMDANKDGAIDEADRAARMEQRRARMFEGLDTDKNGQISREEFMAFKHEGKRGKHHRMGKQHKGHGLMAKMADTNNDGKVAKAEFTAASLKRFDKADTNNDGKLTREERQTAREEMRSKWRDKTDRGTAN